MEWVGVGGGKPVWEVEEERQEENKRRKKSHA
jgi:hypothetical protein